MGDTEVDQRILSDIQDRFVGPDVLADRDKKEDTDNLTDDGKHDPVFSMFIKYFPCIYIAVDQIKIENRLNDRKNRFIDPIKILFVSLSEQISEVHEKQCVGYIFNMPRQFVVIPEKQVLREFSFVKRSKIKQN